jgi:hypothetical protein
MSKRFQDWEDVNRRQTWEEADGTAYRRYYNVPVDVIGTSTLPIDGDALPGETSSLLGPFIVRGGIQYAQQPQGAKQLIIITGKLLKART